MGWGWAIPAKHVLFVHIVAPHPNGRFQWHKRILFISQWVLKQFGCFLLCSQTRDVQNYSYNIWKVITSLEHIKPVINLNPNPNPKSKSHSNDNVSPPKQATFTSTLQASTLTLRSSDSEKKCSSGPIEQNVLARFFLFVLPCWERVAILSMRLFYKNQARTFCSNNLLEHFFPTVTKPQSESRGWKMACRFCVTAVAGDHNMYK